MTLEETTKRLRKVNEALKKFKKLEKITTILKEINDFPDLSQNNIIEQIKAKLAEEDSDKYTKWKEENFDINYGFTTSDSRDVKEKVTLLYLAASFGCTKVVETLLDNEAKIDVTDENGFTPLHSAVCHACAK